MHEIRMFELEGGAQTSWRVRRPQVLELVDGLVWATIEGVPTDYWLGPRGCVELPVGSRVWLSAESPVVRFSLLEGRQSVSEHWLFNRIGSQRLFARVFWAHFGLRERLSS